MRPVPEYDPRAWLTKALRETAHAMEALIWELDGADLARRPSDGEWNPRDLLWHMWTMERRHVERLERIVRLDEPRIEAFDADAIAAREEDAGEDAFTLVDEFGAQRQRSVYLLWSLDDGDWERRGIHPYLGPVTLLQAAREMNEHDLAHLWQLRRICDRSAAATA